MRTRDEPSKWSLSGVEPQTFSSLNASVPEFVPGQMFRVAPSSSLSNATDAAEPPLSGRENLTTTNAAASAVDDVAVVTDDTAAEVLSRLEEMSVYTTSAAKAANSADTSADDTLPDDASDNQDAALERLNTSSADEHSGKEQRT